MSSLVAVIPYSNKVPPSLVYHLSAVGFCPFISVLLSCTGVTSLPDRVQGFALHVPPHSSPLGGFYQTPSVEELSQLSPVQGEPWANCPWKARPSSQAPSLQLSIPMANLPFPECLEGVYMGALQCDGLHLLGTASGAHVLYVLQPAGCSVWAGSRAGLSWVPAVLCLQRW